MKRNQLNHSTTSKPLEEIARQKSGKIDAGAYNGQADKPSTSSKPVKRQLVKFGKKISQSCGSQLASKLHQTTLSMFAVRKSTKNSATKSSAYKKTCKNPSKDSEPSSLAKVAPTMHNQADIACTWVSAACPSSSLFSLACDDKLSVAGRRSSPNAAHPSLHRSGCAPFGGRLSRNGDDNIDSEADFDDTSALLAPSFDQNVLWQQAPPPDFENVAPVVPTIEDVTIAHRAQHFTNNKAHNPASFHITGTTRTSAFSHGTTAIDAPSFDEVNSSVWSSSLQHERAKNKRSHGTADESTDQRVWCPIRLPSEHSQKESCSSQFTAITEKRIAPSCPLQYNPAFRVSAPTHVGTLKFRFGAIPLPQQKWADEESVWNLMCWKDTIYCRNPHLMPQHPCLQSRMRSILIDWLSEVCEEYKLHRETFYLAVDFIDRFLSKTQNVSKDNLQLIGVTALFVAAKLEEIYPPRRGLFADITAGACTAEDIEKMEMVLLKTLNWALCPVTSIHWASTYLQIVDCLENRHNDDTTDSDRHTPRCAGNLDVMQNDGESANCKPWNGKNCNEKHACDSRGLDRSETPVPCLKDQNRKMRSGKNGGSLVNSAGVKLKNNVLHATYQRHYFVHIAQLIDLCIMDLGSLKFPYGVLAACAFAHIVEPENLALHVSGFKFEDIAACYHWMIPFARCIQEKGDLCIKQFHEISDDDMHNIQTHAVDMKLLERALILQHEMLHSRHSPVFIGLNNIFPTPPPSDERPVFHTAPVCVPKFALYSDQIGRQHANALN